MRSTKRIPIIGSCSLFLAIALLAMPAAGAPPDSLAAGFQDPPPSARPHTWWHWMNGNVTREGITADLEAMQRVGIGGAQIFNVDCGIPAGPVKFLGPEWRQLMRHAAREADRLGLELCLHNCAGWSSSGGPWNTPENSMQRLVAGEVTVQGPGRFSGVLPLPAKDAEHYRDIAVLAFRIEDTNAPGADWSKAAAPGREKKRASRAAAQRPVSASPRVAADPNAMVYPRSKELPSGPAVQRSGIIDLTRKLQADGRLEWEVPEGNWILLRLGHLPTGRKNHPAPHEGTGPECDKLSAAAFDAHWAGFVEQVLEELGPLAGKDKAFNNVLIDSYEVGHQTWTPQFRAEFKKRRGYDLLSYLPAAAGHVVDSPEVTRRFLWDMRRTIADLFADSYFGRFQERCHQRGLIASIEPYTGPFNPLECGGKADIPMGEFWVGEGPHLSLKLASSAGHIYGQPIIGAEAFTAAPRGQHSRWLDDPYSLKALGDLVFCQGINRYIFHRYAMQPWTNRWPGMTMGQWGTHFDRTSTWWEQGKPWLQYVARCQYLLQQGRFIADVAYFPGESTELDPHIGNYPPPPGYDCDGVNAEVLQRAVMKDGRLTLASGANYRLLILPASERVMSPRLLRKLATFVENGLILVGPPPLTSPSLEQFPACDAEVKRLSARLWANCDGTNITDNTVTKGKVVWGRPLTNIFGLLGLQPDFEYSRDTGARLAYIHRQDGDADVYFVSNQRNSYSTIDCTFRVDGKNPEFWDPQTGRIAPAPVWRSGNGRTAVRMSFDPAGSIFVVFRPGTPKDHIVAVEKSRLPGDRIPRPPAEMRILKALYGAFDPASPPAANVTEKVQALVADGKLQIPAGNDLAGNDPAPGSVKRLRIDFTLGAEQKSLDAVEGKSVTLPEGATVVKALYGNLPGLGPLWVDLTDRIQSLFAAGTRQFRAGNDFADGDPAPNMPKQLRIEYRLNDTTQTNEVTEGNTLELPAGIEIVKATYGALNSPAAQPATGQTADLTEKIVALAANGELNIAINNMFAGGDPAPGKVKELRVEYTLDGVPRQITVPEHGNLVLPPNPAADEAMPPFALAGDEDGRTKLVAWAPGTYTFAWASGRTNAIDCETIAGRVELTGPWRVRFPAGWGAPAQVVFDQLASWTANTNPGVKYFSGTATYLKEFELTGDVALSSDEIWLELGEVKNLAEIVLNGKPLGIVWKPPFRVNAAAALRTGKNQLEIRVTNLWPNRLIGDEQLPPDCEWRGKQLVAWPQWLEDGKPSPSGRVTFTTWRHWAKDDALLESGLLGPVTIQTAATFAVR